MCILLVFIANVSLWWRRGSEKFRNILFSRPRRCSWRCVVKPYWNRFWRSLTCIDQCVGIDEEMVKRRGNGLGQRQHSGWLRSVRIRHTTGCWWKWVLISNKARERQNRCSWNTWFHEKFNVPLAKFMDAISVFVYGYLALVELSIALWAVKIAGLTCTLHTVFDIDFVRFGFVAQQTEVRSRSMKFYTDYYPYKAYLQTLLKYGSDAKNSYLSTQLWMKDTTSHFDDVDFTNGDNTNGIVGWHTPFWPEMSNKIGEFSEMFDVGCTFYILIFSTPVWVGGKSKRESSEGIPSTKNSLLIIRSRSYHHRKPWSNKRKRKSNDGA
jgi:hypothetical protein